MFWRRGYPLCQLMWFHAEVMVKMRVVGVWSTAIKKEPVYMCFGFWWTSTPNLLPWLCPWTPLGTSVPQAPYTEPSDSKTRLRPYLGNRLSRVENVSVPTKGGVWGEGIEFQQVELNRRQPWNQQGGGISFMPDLFPLTL